MCSSQYTDRITSSLQAWCCRPRTIIDLCERVNHMKKKNKGRYYSETVKRRIVRDWEMGRSLLEIRRRHGDVTEAVLKEWVALYGNRPPRY